MVDPLVAVRWRKLVVGFPSERNSTSSSDSSVSRVTSSGVGMLELAAGVVVACLVIPLSLLEKGVVRELDIVSGVSESVS